MAVAVCSLILATPQSIPPGGYHLVRFPYGAEGESLDAHQMHPAEQPDRTVSTWPDDRSALIWPSTTGWGALTAMIQWAPGAYTELRDRFVRDPLGLDTGADSTATDHRPPSPGMQCFTKHHEILVRPTVPLALMVSHNDTVARDIVHAQFKLTIHPMT